MNKPKFDPNAAYEVVDEKPKFDPSKPFEEVESESPLMTGGREFLQGASAGLSDEFSGGVEALGKALGVEGAGGKIKDIKLSKEGPTLDWETLRDAYVRARDLEREALKKGKEENPEAAIAANIAGSIVSPVNKLMPGASLAKQGAVVGGLTGLGAAEGDLSEQGKQALQGAAMGGVLGKALDVATPLVQKGVQSLGQKSEQLANRLAARALGAERGTIKKLGLDKVEDIGRYALDEGVVTPFSNADELVKRNEALQQKAGQMMSDVYSQIDEAGASTFNPLDVASQVENKIGGFYRSPINRGETNQLENTLESILMRGDKNISLKEAQALKEELGKVAKWKQNLQVTDKEQMARDAYGVVSQAIDKATEEGAKSINKEGLSELLTQGKKLYSSSKGAEELLTNKLAREQGNKLFGLTDAITAGAATTYGAATGDWKDAAYMFAGKKALERLGPQTGAIAFDKLSKALANSPQMAQALKNNPQVFNALVNQLGQRMPVNEEKSFEQDGSQDAVLNKVRGSEYEQVLQNAANNGQQSFAAANYVLQNRDEKYRKMLKGEK